jgi:hypothetical protein
VLIRNASGGKVSIPELGINCQPGDTAEIESGYCRVRLTPNGHTMPSILEMLAPGAFEIVAETIEAVEAAAEADQRNLIREGVPPALAAIEAQNQAQRRGKRR